MAQTKRCRQCGERYPEELPRCPNCHARAKGGSRLKKESKSWVSIIVVVVALLALAAAVFFIYSALHPDSGVQNGKHTSIPSPSPSNSPAEQTGEPSGSGNNETTPEPSDSGQQDPVDSIVLHEYEATLVGPGDTVQLFADIYPATSQGALVWVSSNEDIATVDSQGLVTGIAEGTVTIMATAGDKRASCVVTVGDAEIEPGTSDSGNSPGTGVKLEIYNIYYKADTFPGEMSISVGETVQMYIDADGDRVDEGIDWSSGDTDVASVDEDGVVKGAGGGTAKITATYKGQSVSCLCRVK